MKKVLVSILSDHLVPNYLFIKEMRGQYNELLFIGTPYTESKAIATHLENALENRKSNIKKVILESDQYQEGVQSLENISLPTDVHYIVNLTGGTKIMSLIVYDFFRKLNSSFYYIPIGKNTYCNIEEENMHALQYRISLREYFTLYGLHYECDNALLKDAETTFQFFEKQKKRKFYLSDEIKKSQKAETAKDKKYYAGEWFEEYTYLRIKKELNLREQDIAMSLKIYREDSQNNDNEIDVAFMYENALYIIECKVSMNGYGKEKWQTIEDYLYKLAAISKDFGLIVRPYIFTLHKMEKLPDGSLKGLQKRMQILGIRNIIDGKQLSKQKIEF
ncbi:Card1-like endonuclease domain-containing protein [Prevotella nigrescens]|jgi:domain of unknown function (DUF1887)|uniref:Card1-like endonuclease domain-containing protein n=1 Tax=Prevotella nigrescens TaxID=28133 RepID=UPI0028899112|nr:DUF1887 family CARF protein [Prevotella nigrescens]